MINVVLDKLGSTFAQIVRENKGVPLAPQQESPNELPVALLVTCVATVTFLTIVVVFGIRRHKH